MLRTRTVAIAVVLGSLFISNGVGRSEEKKSWSGVWNNRKYGTKGTLTCSAEPSEKKMWKAKFEGIGLGERFEYDVTMQATKKGNAYLLSGISNVSGDRYQWRGYIKGGVLYGTYRSASGNNGEFRLKEKR